MKEKKVFSLVWKSNFNETPLEAVSPELFDYKIKSTTVYNYISS